MIRWSGNEWKVEISETEGWKRRWWKDIEIIAPEILIVWFRQMESGGEDRFWKTIYICISNGSGHNKYKHVNIRYKILLTYNMSTF